MRQRFPQLRICPEIGSIANAQRVREILELYRPSQVFHAAAYKHVPMMEYHPFEAVENNVFGTAVLAHACIAAQVRDFVMISSDKAVRATNIMGATKRVAELLIASLQNSPGSHTNFVSVRFGNVLGSNGSVVPIFKSQIQAGGPVLVTHPEVKRFFMTIPEAARLVLQAAALGAGGGIYVLDMGEPLKIVDVARNLILLSGLKPDEDIRIEYIGLRPGEKLYEEIAFLDEDTLPTAHPSIRCFVGRSMLSEEMSGHLARLREQCATRNLAGLVLELKQLAPEYSPSAYMLQRMLQPGARTASTAVAR
jgi:FlaA1/EpsC-like NDP-sugar epimerase